ncbi:MAG: winged helix-turn-helix domain-containing protein [Candidatus Hermodarchaeia archaeon]
MNDKKRRSNIEISADILKVALHGAKKSHIVYRANLNFEVVKRYLQRLSEDDSEGEGVHSTLRKPRQLHEGAVTWRDYSQFEKNRLWQPSPLLYFPLSSCSP